MEAEAKDWRPDSPAQALLIDQGRLIRWQIASERAGFALKMLTASTGLAVAAALCLMIWNASRDRSIVVEPFSVPPELAAQGLTGEVVASRVLDQLLGMRAATPSVLEDPRVGGSADERRLEVQIPGSGVSVGEIDRALTAWLGRQTRVRGEVTLAAAADDILQLSVTARAGGRAGVTVVGPMSGLDALITRAAEPIYAATDPPNYAAYLATMPARWADADRAYTIAVAVADPKARAHAYAGWSLLSQGRGDFPGMLAKARLAAAGDRDSVLVGALAVAAEQISAGRSEALLKAIRSFRDRGRRSGGSDAPLLFRRAMAPAELRALRELRGAATEAELLGDFAGAHLATARVAVMTRDRLPQIADAMSILAARSAAEAHDISLARRWAPAGGDSRAAVTDNVLGALPATAAALALEDWPAALGHLRAAKAATAAHPDLSFRQQYLITHQPEEAYALARLGRWDEARVTLAELPACYDCDIGRARVAVLAGDWPRAERAFAAAVRQGPSLPFAYLEWGRARLARGDAGGAIAQLSLAHARGPRFADPLEFWGEALLAQGEAKGADAKFAEAAKFAPRWGRLHLKWGEALAAQGKAAEAKAKWRAAAGMDLTPAERARVQALVQRPTV